MSKTIFITGASTGLGHATTRLFAERRWKVIATMRNPESSELAHVPNVTLVPLDVTKPAQIDVAVQRALELGPVDVVFNNAGYGLIGPLEGLSDEQLVAQFETNLLGTIRVTRAFVPAFRERGSGVFIATTSIGGLTTFPLGSTYHATKWALEGWSESLAYELQEFGIQVKTVAPGSIRTDFSGRSLVIGEHPAYATLLQKLWAMFKNPAREAYRSNADQIAEVVWEAATDGKNQVCYLAGDDAKAFVAQRRELGVEGFRKQIRAMVFG